MSRQLRRLINMFDSAILKKMMARYGHIDDLDQLQSATSEDGFGGFVDLLNNNSELFNSSHKRNFFNHAS
jgi:hypothetical protein